MTQILQIKNIFNLNPLICAIRVICGKITRPFHTLKLPDH